MKANIPKQPKVLDQLDRASIDRLNRYYNDVLYDAKQKISTDVQRIMIKYWCCILHECGVSNDDIMIYLGNFRRYRRLADSKKTNDEVEQELDRRIAEYMPDFPEGYIEKLIER